jgi:predicted HTH domain antitoxin
VAGQTIVAVRDTSVPESSNRRSRFPPLANSLDRSCCDMVDGSWVFGEGGWRMETWQTKDLVSAGLYENEDDVVQDAIRALLSERPQLRLELAIHRYRREEISLAKAAALAGVSWERMRELLLSRGLQPRLGPETKEEAYEEIQAMERIIREDPG